MGISLRHHVLSLVAIFLMLLVGLLVGVGLSSQPELTTQINQLSEQFQGLMNEITGLEKDAASQERFAQGAFPKLVAHKLDKRDVVLIVTAQPANNRVAEAISKALEAAGARVPYRLIVRSDFAGRAAAAYGQRVPLTEAGVKAAGRIAAAVARGKEGDLRALEQERLCRLDGRPVNTAPWGVVVLGGTAQPPPDPATEVQRPILEGLLGAGITNIVGCEPRGSPLPAGTYRDLDLSTVDNVDLVRGQASLVLALAGQPGRYGDGPSAEQEFAPLE